MPIPTTEEKLDMIRIEPPTEEELAAVESLAPGDYEIGFQRTNDILDEALQVFQRSSRSNMGGAGDVMVAVFTAQGDLANAAAGTYLHAIIQPIMIKYILRRYADNPGVRDGDVWFANDALYGGIHNPDNVIVIPVFHEGKLIAWCGGANHTGENGAIEPGGMPVSARSRFEEGMNLPPVKVGEDGELREDWIETFMAFGIRAPQVVVTDLRARATAADRARTRLLEMADREGQDFVVGILRKMLMVAEEGTRRRIASFPDGVYRAASFADGVGKEVALIRSANLTLTKDGDSMYLDFTGTSPENMSPYNGHAQAAIGHLANYLYSYAFYDLPISSATFAPIHCMFPPGTLVNPSPRAATSLSVQVLTGVMDVIQRVFAKMMFATDSWDRVAASPAHTGNGQVIAGVSQWGALYSDVLAYALNTDGQGGRAIAAGMDASHFSWCPFGRAPDVEFLENEFPLLIPLSQLWVDSGGHGKHRGGAATVQVWVSRSPEIFFGCTGDNSKVQTSQPLFGGYGPPTIVGIGVRGADIMDRLRSNGAELALDFETLLTERQVSGNWELEFNSRSVRSYEEGDIINFAFSGGGSGYGDPLDAEPEEVVDDILVKQVVSEWAGSTIYKVAYDKESGTADLEATERLREEARQARLSAGKSWADFHTEWSDKAPPEPALKYYGAWPTAEATSRIVRQ
jgi:N-methylhydantoinase B/oxoprolinase/acetone carboxylase alpha subunit